MNTLQHLIILIVFFMGCVLPSRAALGADIAKIGFLSPRAEHAEGEKAFQQGLRELGWVEGQTLKVEWRFTSGKEELFPVVADELVRLSVNVIVVGGRQAALAAKKITQKIPIVIAAAGDPVAAGLTASLARPGGNVTGLSIDAPGLNGKRLELLKQSFPKLSRIAVLYRNVVPGWETNLAEAKHSAEVLKINLHSVNVGLDERTGLTDAFSTVLRQRDEALLKLPAAETPSYRKRIIDLAAKSRLPAMYDDKVITGAGGLMSYGTDVPELYRRAATYVDKILKGAKPGDLPVEQPTKFEFIVNLKAAKQIGLTIPPNVLARADRVIR